MQQTVNLSDVIFELSIRGLTVRLSNMAGVSTGSTQILIVCALLGLIALLLLRFGEPILWAIFGKPEPAEPGMPIRVDLIEGPHIIVVPAMKEA